MLIHLVLKSGEPLGVGTGWRSRTIERATSAI
jgi:hypothetical protein